MGKIDTSGWKEFRVGELFEVKISKSVDKGGLEFAENGEYDFIGRTPLNNGIQGKLNKLKFEANQEGTYSIAQIGMHVCQYRERKWYASQNLFVLTPFTEKSHKANKFIATVITRYLDCAYGEDTYATYPTVKTLPLLKIKLPVDKTGQPDWAYMESYMANLETKVAESLTLLQAAKDAEKKKVDTREWREFHLYDIFSISMGNKFDRSKMCEVDEGINFVGRSALTNGVACAVTSVEDKKGNTVQPYPAGDITIALGGSIGAAFVQDREFYTSQNVCVLHTDDPSITERAKWFVSASITASCGNYEAFTDELNRHIRTDFIIRLPVDKTGQPDWGYMEEYMRKVKEKTENTLNQFMLV
jgi:hypothetical protein